MKGRLEGVTRRLGKKFSGSATIGLVHFTALLACSMRRDQLRACADYFRPGLHPRDHDTRECRKQIDAFLAEQQKLAA